MKERFAYVDRRLEGQDYLMGATFCVADAYLFTISNWADKRRRRHVTDLEEPRRLPGARRRASRRKEAMKAEGLVK